MKLERFDQIWCVDTEFTAPDGELPEPICLVAREFKTGKLVRLWADDLRKMTRAPFPTDRSALFVAYSAEAEFGVFLELGWPLPERVLDLHKEFRCLTNGKVPTNESGLLNALVYCGLDSMGAEEKTSMRELAKRGGPYTEEERVALLDYCRSDADALVRLLRRMVAYLDCDGRVCLRGRHAKAVAWIERVSTHLDRSLLERLWETWPVLKLQLISKINRQFGVYEGTVFKQKSFARLVKFKGWPWPLTPTGLLATDNETFRDMSKLHPELEPLRQLRASLHQLRGQQLVIGKDDRNRVSLFSFGAVTGRNTPKASQFVFSPAVWLRGLIRPEPGFAMVYLDWSAEEFAIAAVLSGDSAMIETYNSGDPYLYLAKQLGMAPEHATKHTHRPIREMFKTICLAINYGMGPSTLAIRIGRSAAQARDILDRIHAMYPKFWKWKEGVHEHAVANKCFYTVYGWKMRCSAATNPRTIGNFPAQGNGAELLRLACCLATEAGVRVAAAVHDALLIEFPIAKLDEHVGLTIAAMRQASRYVLDGFELRVSGHNQPIVYPQRFSDERGVTMWNTVMELLDERQAA